MMNSDQSQKVSMSEQFSASIFLSSCVIPDESIFKQLEVINILDMNLTSTNALMLLLVVE